MAMMGCSSLYKLNYPAGKVVTMGAWTASMDSKPAAYVEYSKIILGAPTSTDWEVAIGECMSKADGKAVTSLRMTWTSAYLFLTAITVSGEVCK